MRRGETTMGIAGAAVTADKLAQHQRDTIEQIKTRLLTFLKNNQSHCSVREFVAWVSKLDPNLFVEESDGQLLLNRAIRELATPRIEVIPHRKGEMLFVDSSTYDSMAELPLRSA